MTNELFIYIYMMIAMGTLALAVYICLGSNVMLVTFSLVGVFFLVGFLLCLLGLEFFGLVYIAVYVGAVCIFFIFALLLFDLRLVGASDVALARDQHFFSFFFFGSVFLFLDLVLSCLFYLNFYFARTTESLTKLVAHLQPELRARSAELVFSDRRYIRWQLIRDEALSPLSSSTGVESTVDFSAAATEPGCNSLNYFLHEKICYLVHEFGSFLYNYNHFFIFSLTVILLIVLVGSLHIVLKSRT